MIRAKQMKPSEQVREPGGDTAPRPRKLLIGTATYVALLVVLWLVARFFNFQALEDYPISTFLGFATLFAPYWLFGFGLAAYLRPVLTGTAERVAVAASLAIPYFVLTLPRRTFYWELALVLIAIPLLVTLVLHTWPRPANWADLVVLATIG